MIARYLDVELDLLVPFLIDGFVFAMPGSKARRNPTDGFVLSRRYDIPRKKRIDRYGLQLIRVTLASDRALS